MVDVYDGEPTSGEGRFDSLLARHPKRPTEHTTSAPPTEQAQLAVAEGVANVIAAFVDDNVINCVNAARDATRGAA